MEGDENNLNRGALRKLFDFARQNLKMQTRAEAPLWQHLRNRQLNRQKFCRQHPIGLYIADFYCFQYKLVIELDGGYHALKDQIEHDSGRTYELEQIGIKIIRFSNEEVIQDVHAVLKAIQQHLTLNPSPPGAGL